jgi:hypothetical protein
MASERKGKAYEALVYLVLCELIGEKKLRGPVNWNVKPHGMSIERDFTAGDDPHCPDTILLLNHSGSSKESEKKMWRNLGELVEAKTILALPPKVYCIWTCPQF